MRKLSLMDLAFFIAESEDSPKHVAGLMLCKKPVNAPANYVKNLLNEIREYDRIAEPFNQVINFLGPMGPHWETCRELSFDDHVFYHHQGKVISWDEAKEKAARLHEPLLDRARPLWEFHVIDGVRGGRFVLYLKLHHAYADGMTMTSWMDKGFSHSADNMEFTPPWAINAEKKQPRQAKPQQTGDLLRGLAGLAKQQLRSARGILKLSAQQAIERAGLTHDAVALLFNTPRDTPLTGSALPGRGIATAGVPMKHVYDLCDATCSTLNHVALACIDGAIHSYLAERGMALNHPVSIQMPVNLRANGDGQTGNRIGITLVDLAQPGLSAYRRLREIGFKLQNVKYQVAGIPAVAFEQFTFLAGGVSEAINKLSLTDVLPSNGHAVVSNVPGPKTARYLHGSKVEHMYPISTLSPGLRLNITMFSYDGILHFGLVATRDLKDLQSMADRIVEEFNTLESSVARRRS